MRSIDTVIKYLLNIFTLLTESLHATIWSIQLADAIASQQAATESVEHMKKINQYMKELIDDHRDELPSYQVKLTPILNLMASLGQIGKEMEEILKQINPKEE